MTTSKEDNDVSDEDELRVTIEGWQVDRSTRYDCTIVLQTD